MIGTVIDRKLKIWINPYACSKVDTAKRMRITQIEAAFVFGLERGFF